MKLVIASFISVIFGVVIGAIGVGVVYSKANRQFMQSAWVVSISDTMNAAGKIRNNKQSEYVVNIDKNIDSMIGNANIILDGDFRRTALWHIKDYVFSNNIPLNEANKKILNELPTRNMTSCEKDGTCPIRPSAIAK